MFVWHHLKYTTREWTKPKYLLGAIFGVLLGWYLGHKLTKLIKMCIVDPMEEDPNVFPVEADRPLD